MAITEEEIRVRLRLISDNFKNVGKDLNKSLTPIKNGVESVGIGFQDSLKDAGNQLKSFRMEFLSIMFGGMLIQRTFQNVMRSGIETFMKISEGATPAGQAITALNAELIFLKFTIGRVIGEALMPLLPHLIAFIRWVTEFTSKNPGLVVAFLVLGFVLGFIMFTLGSLILLANGLAMAFGGTASIMFIGILKVLGVLILLGIIIFAIKQIGENWGKDWGATIKWIGIAVMALAGIFLIFGAASVGVWILLAGVAIYVISVIVSHWDEMVLGFKSKWGDAWNWIVDKVEWALNGIIGMINGIAGFDVFEKVGFGRIDVSEATRQLEELRAANKNKPGMIDQFKGELAGLQSSFGLNQFAVPEENTGTGNQTSATTNNITNNAYGDILVNYSGNDFEGLLDDIKRKT